MGQQRFWVRQPEAFHSLELWEGGAKMFKRDTGRVSSADLVARATTWNAPRGLGSMIVSPVGSAFLIERPRPV